MRFWRKAFSCKEVLPSLRHPTQNLRKFVHRQFVLVNKSSITYGRPASIESPQVSEVLTLHTKNTCHLSATTSANEQITVLSLLWNKIFFGAFLGQGKSWSDQLCVSRMAIPALNQKKGRKFWRQYLKCPPSGWTADILRNTICLGKLPTGKNTK